MSRFPFGLWLCLTIPLSGCTTFVQSTGPVPGIASTPPLANSPTPTVPVKAPLQRPVSLWKRSERIEPFPVQLGTAQPWPHTSFKQQHDQAFETVAPSESAIATDTDSTYSAVLPTGPAASPKQLGLQTDSQPTAPTVQPAKQPVVERLNVAAMDDVFNKYVSSAERQLKIRRFGTGPWRVLILGSIYGNEPESITLLDQLMADDSPFADQTQTTFLCIRTPNPDGLLEHIRTNSHGVDLNRNFPSTWFTANPNRLTGPHPASEVETRNLMEIIKVFQPQRVLHVRSSIGVRPLVVVNDQLQHAVPHIAHPQLVDAGLFTSDYKIGSLEEFVEYRTDAELMTIHLPPRGFEQLSPSAVLTLATSQFKDASEIAAATSQPRETPRFDPFEATPPVPAERPATQPAAQPPSSQNSESSQQPDGAKGFVELLPPPPILPQNANEPDDSRYYELPPPPVTPHQAMRTGAS